MVIIVAEKWLQNSLTPNQRARHYFSAIVPIMAKRQTDHLEPVLETVSGTHDKRFWKRWVEESYCLVPGNENSRSQTLAFDERSPRRN
ncbi:MAG: hypothetical protein EBR02_10170 [Alphaproteobacteria bacterium]|nr:hypothetical protein [Alphaproteobacteria bacterium]